MLLGIAGAIAALITVPLTVAALTGENLSVPGLEAARSVLAMLQDRSPGERTEAELTKTKRAREAPHQRALGKVRPPELPQEFVEAIAPPPVIDVAPAAPVIAGIPPLDIPPPGSSPIVTFGPPPGPPVPPGAPGPPGPPGAPEPPGPPDTPVPPLPEPGTWAMMLLGFGMTGWTLRRRRREDAALRCA